MTRTVMAGVLAVLAGAACGDADEVTGRGALGLGPTRILLTGATLSNDTLARADVFVVRVDVATSTDTTAAQVWHPVAEPRRTFNLMDLQAGLTAFLGTTDVHFGSVALVRVVLDVDRSHVTFRDGSPAIVVWDAEGELAVHAVVEQPLVNWASEEGDIVLAFDAGRSFRPASESLRLWNLPVDLVFLPLIRAVNAQAAATIHGTVRRTSVPGLAVAVPGAAVVGLRTVGLEESLLIAASARTDSLGRYELRYLNPGGYLLAATAPTGVAFGRGQTPHTFPLLMGDDVTIDIMLGPADTGGSGTGGSVASVTLVPGVISVSVGDSLGFWADLRDSAGVALSGRAVAWTVSNASILRIDGQFGQSIILRALAAGSVTVTATSEGKSGSGTVTVN